MNKLRELKPDALGGLSDDAKPEEALAYKVKFNSWYQRFRRRQGFSIRRRTSVGQKLPKGYEGMAWATLVKLREALVERAGEIYAERNPPAPGDSPIKGEDLTAAQLKSVEAEVFEELGNMDQTPVQHEMPVETTLEETGAKDARIATGGERLPAMLLIFRYVWCFADTVGMWSSIFCVFVVASLVVCDFLPGTTLHLHLPRWHKCQSLVQTLLCYPPPCILCPSGKEKERFTLCLAVIADGKKVPLRIIYKGTPFIPPDKPGKGKSTQPRKNSIAWEILPANRSAKGYPAGGMSFGVQEKSWCDLRECNIWIKDSWKLRPNNGSIIKQRPCILVLDDFKCHKDEIFIAELKRQANTIVILIPGGLTPLLQPLDRMLNKQMKRLLRGIYTRHQASAQADPKTGKLKPPGRGLVAKWCKEAWASITPETVKTCFKICGLTLALDGSEDHAWCSHNFGEGYRELLEQQRVNWLAEHPDVPLPPIKLPEVRASTTNHIEAAAKELEAKLLPPGDDSDVEIVDDDSDVEVVEGEGGLEVVEL